MPPHHLPVVVPCPVKDVLVIGVARLVLSEAARKALKLRNVFVLAELAMMTRSDAVEKFGKDVAVELDRALMVYGCKLGSLTRIEEFLTPQSTLNLDIAVQIALRQAMNLPVGDPSCLAIVLHGRLDMRPAMRTQLDDTMRPLTGLRTHMYLHEIFVEALTSDAVEFYNLDVRSIGLPEEVADFVIFDCGRTVVHELYHLARTPGFPYRNEVEQAFTAHEQSLVPELQWGHWQQIYNIV